jgi:hypothetical protein
MTSSPGHRAAARSAHQPAARGRRGDGAPLHVLSMSICWRVAGAYPMPMCKKRPSNTRTSTAAGCISTYSPPALRCAPPRLPNNRAPRKQAQQPPAKGRKVLLQPDLRRSELVPLAACAARTASRCGAKAANLGEIQSARLADVSVPDGFAFRSPPMPTSCAPTAWPSALPACASSPVCDGCRSPKAGPVRAAGRNRAMARQPGRGRWLGTALVRPAGQPGRVRTQLFQL